MGIAWKVSEVIDHLLFSWLTSVLRSRSISFHVHVSCTFALPLSCHFLLATNMFKCLGTRTPWYHLRGWLGVMNNYLSIWVFREYCILAIYCTYCSTRQTFFLLGYYSTTLLSILTLITLHKQVILRGLFTHYHKLTSACFDHDIGFVHIAVSRVLVIST